MDYYKKKNLKFNSEVRREIRHAETVRARESSRFKRLSMLRCIDEDLEQLSVEKPKEIARQEAKKPVSRLEILRQWKQEKIIKKELEKKNSIRPFYAGVSSLRSANKGTSKIGKCNQQSGNMSSISKKIPSCNSSLVSRVPNTSKLIESSCISNQASRIPNNSKQVSSYNSVQTSRIPNCSKQVSSSATLISRIQNSSKPLGTVPKTTKNTHPQLQRIPSSSQEFAKKPTVYGNNSKTNQVLLKSKVQTCTSSPASSLNVSSSTKSFQSRIAKPASLVPGRIPVQSKLPVSNNQKPITALNKKLPSSLTVGLQLPASSTIQKSAPGLIKKPGFVSKVNLKKAPPVSENQKQEKKAFSESTANKSKESSDVEEKNVESTYSVDCKPESGSERNIESLSDIFDCDVSIIKHAPSFAPENFTFKPPCEILDFSFDYSILKKIKEFTSRTSTPSKQHIQGTESDDDDDDDKEIMQKPSENADIETDISTLSKQPAQSCVNDKDDKEIIQKPFEYLDVETNVSTPAKQPAQICVNDEDDKETPFEYLDVETNISTPSRLCVEVYKRDADNKETMHESFENVDIEDNILTPKPGQDSESDDDNKAMQRSSENVNIEIKNSFPSEDLVQDSENCPLKINLQDSHNSSQPACHNSAVTDEEMMLKDWESVVSETEKIVDLTLKNGVDSEKYKEKYKDSLQNTFQKRRSILKKSTLNSIAETDDILSLSPVPDGAENKENILCKMPRRSRRISNLISIDESPSTTPEHSRRISKLISVDESPSSSPRRSLRLQRKLPKNNQLDDSNYRGHTNLTNDFDKLTLEDFDKMNPDDYLCDPFDSPENIQSKKVSLLYSPDKRKSIRRSIRGDLMSFSPLNSPRV